MKAILTTLVLVGGLLLWPTAARAHCDAVDGPVATAPPRGPSRPAT